MKKDLAAAYMAKRKRQKGVSDLDLEPRESKANLFSNEEMMESPFQDEGMSDHDELAEHDMSVDSMGDNTEGNVNLESIMKKLRSQKLRG